MLIPSSSGTAARWTRFGMVLAHKTMKTMPFSRDFHFCIIHNSLTIVKNLTFFFNEQNCSSNLHMYERI
jgi:hypothetical protein